MRVLWLSVSGVQAAECVESEVAARLEAIGADRQLWPAAAREEAARLEARASTLSSVMAALQKELDAEVAGRFQERRHLVRHMVLDPRGYTVLGFSV